VTYIAHRLVIRAAEPCAGRTSCPSP